MDRYMAELQYFLSVEYEENMELIDTRINSYYNLANTRIMQMASSRVRLENLLGDFLDRVSRISKEEQDAAMEKVEKCTRVINQEIRWLQIVRAEPAYPQRRSEYRIKHQCDVGRRCRNGRRICSAVHRTAMLRPVSEHIWMRHLDRM